MDNPLFSGRLNIGHGEIELIPYNWNNPSVFEEEIIHVSRVNPGSGLPLLDFIPQAYRCRHFNDPVNPQPREYARCIRAVNGK